MILKLNILNSRGALISSNRFNEQSFDIDWIIFPHVISGIIRIIDQNYNLNDAITVVFKLTHRERRIQYTFSTTSPLDSEFFIRIISFDEVYLRSRITLLIREVLVDDIVEPNMPTPTGNNNVTFITGSDTTTERTVTTITTPDETVFVGGSITGIQFIEESPTLNIRSVQDIINSMSAPSSKKNNDMYKLILKFENNEILEAKDVQYNIASTLVPLTVINNQSYIFESVQSALDFGFIEDKKTCSWYKPSFNTPQRIFSPNTYFKFKNSYFQRDPSTYLLTEGKKYTFGVEFECSELLLPAYKYSNLNVDCVRDGSLNEGLGGPEIITGVLFGDNGLNHLQKICNELTSRGTVNKTCGLHLHLGNFDFSKENLVYLYKLCLLLEEEIFTLVPKSRRNNVYCKRLDDLLFKSDLNQDSLEYKININNDLKKLINYIAYDKKSKFLTRKKNHPMGAKCGYRHETPRYCWVNFVPAIFNTRESEKSKTIEIRVHSGTTSYYKTKNWLLLWSAVLWFVDNKKQDIKNGITVNQILYEAYPKRGGKIVDYFLRRKLQFETKEGEEKDYIQEVESIKSIKEEL